MKRIPTFVAGMLTAAVIGGLGVGALAASGAVTFNASNLMFNGTQISAKGEGYTLDNGCPAFVGDIYTSYVNPQASFDGEKIVVNEYDAKYDAGMITSKSGKYSNMGTNYLLSDMIFTEFPQFKDELISEIKNGYISCISYNGSVYIDAVNAIQFFRSKDIEIYGSGGYFYEVPNN